MNGPHYEFVYWISDAFFDDIETFTLAVGLLRSFESVESCSSFGIGAAKIKPMVNLNVAFVMFTVYTPLTFAATLLVPECPSDERKARSDDETVEVEKTIDGGVVDALRGDSV